MPEQQVCLRCQQTIGFFDWLTRKKRDERFCSRCYADLLEEEWQQTLFLIRQGNLPIVPADVHQLSLHSNEICHLAISALYHKQNRREMVYLPGMLISTDKHLYFIANNQRSTTIQWSNVMHIACQNEDRRRRTSGGVFLTLAKGTGAGFYGVDKPEYVAAILETEVRIAKRQLVLTHDFEGRRKPIPQHVISQVFYQYGGKCAGCGAYGRGVELQVDHRIPWSLGGSDDIGNLQLLCSVCNKKKGQRI